MIQINNLVKKFDDFTALDGVNMNVEKGAVYGLVGPNGAGKSTLIRHITGVMRQDAGEVFIDGEPVYENARIKGQMAYIPDDMFYFLQSDTINMMHYYKGMYPNFDEKQFYRMQEFFPSIDVKRNIRKLSKGMQKQVAFWLALCCKPKLIVLDEPVDGLDPVMRRQIWSIMLDDVAVNNTTVVVSSHNLRELEDVCDHVGILNNGKIMIERSLTELQGNISKIQIACPYGMPKIPQDFKVLHMSNIGRVYTVIVRGEPDAVVKAITDGKDSPQVVDGGLHGGEKLLRHCRDAQPMHFLQSCIHAPGRIVGQKPVAPAPAADIFQKFRRPGQQGFLQVKGSIQVQQK